MVSPALIPLRFPPFPSNIHILSFSFIKKKQLKQTNKQMRHNKKGNPNLADGKK